ncbi:MAG: pyridoxal-phosphate dependent enzyme, partial [Desulfurococcales archaeon]|nr:pyridoxal-phosphate dependent enzyme [Desulfurococcales archaeon]
FEIADEVGVPDWVVVPVGNGGNISAIWKGFKELKEAGLVGRLPKLAGVQAAGAAPLAKAFTEGLSKPEFVDNPETVATAIRIGKPVNWSRALRAVRESRGVLTAVTDDEILKAQELLARFEGLGVEPASAASLAGLIKLREEGVIDADETVVLVATGHALKDPDVTQYHSVRSFEVSGEDALTLIRELTKPEA